MLGSQVGCNLADNSECSVNAAAMARTASLAGSAIMFDKYSIFG